MSLLVPPDYRRPILKLMLPPSAQAVDVLVRNATTGKSLALILPDGWDGDDLTLDFYRRAITDQEGSDRSSLLSPTDSDLWVEVPLLAGANDLEIEVLGPVASLTKTPSTVANSAAVGTLAWANPENAKSENGAYAKSETIKAATTTNYLKATGYAFGLDPKAIPVGIEFAPKVFHSGISPAPPLFKQVKLLRAGAVEPTNKVAGETFFPNAAGVVTFGGDDDLWGGAWIASDLNNANFGVVLAAGATAEINESAEADSMPITAYYRDVVAFAATAEIRWQRGYP